MNQTLIRRFRKLVVALAFLLAGCATSGAGIKPHTVGYIEVYTQGSLTPAGQRVEPETFVVPGMGWSWGEGYATSGPTGTISGYNPDGSRRYEKFGGRR